MIPTHYYSGGIHGYQYGDAGFLSEWLGKLPIRKQRPVAVRYSEIYSELVIKDPNKCRYRANCWLRKTVDKYKVTD